MKYILILVITINWQLGFAQISFPVVTHHETPQAFKYLLETNRVIDENDTINEAILDLVNPMVADSVLDRKKEHHQLFLVGWLIHAFGGYNWRAVSMHKEKFVGTVIHDGRNGEVEFTEYDIKYHLNFHLKKYLSRIFDSYDMQKSIHRQDVRGGKHRTNYNVAPFVRDTGNIDIRQYDIGCELTPLHQQLPQLHYLFFPTLPGMSLKTHPNFGTNHPSMGVYGANCLDCNHNCHPEMHPYEWIWWLNLQDKAEQSKTWLVGLFREASNRFPYWSHGPKTGSISIPFAFSVCAEKGNAGIINIEHLVFNRFNESGLSKLSIPDSCFGAKSKTQLININGSESEQFSFTVNFNNIMPSDGLKYWFTDINWDERSCILSGYLNMAISVKDLYTARVTFNSSAKKQ
jgi:hypothetical protein